MRISKGLIVADPWIGYLLDGSKTWEMRSSSTSVRGPLGLIRKGTGAVWGVATLDSVGAALTPAEMIGSFEKHRIPPEMIQSGAVAKWNIPWVVSNVRPLARPVSYNHPSGAVTWVNLADNVCAAIVAQIDGAPSLRPFAPERSVSSSEHSKATSSGSIFLQTQLTDGNIKNSLFYLRGHLHRFPSDIVGGPNLDAKASKEATIDWGGPTPAMSDIDSEKQFFRRRGWIKQFFETAGARAGDWVYVEEVAPYHYRVSLGKA